MGVFKLFKVMKQPRVYGLVIVSTQKCQIAGNNSNLWSS